MNFFHIYLRIKEYQMAESLPLEFNKATLSSPVSFLFFSLLLSSEKYPNHDNKQVEKLLAEKTWTGLI